MLASKNRPNKIEELRDYYMESLPLVAPDEILIDKNSEYVVGHENHVEDIAKAIKIINPNIKIITFVCDPNLRVVSKLLGSLPNVWPKLILYHNAWASHIVMRRRLYYGIKRVTEIRATKKNNLQGN